MAKQFPESEAARNRHGYNLRKRNGPKSPDPQYQRDRSYSLIEQRKIANIAAEMYSQTNWHTLSGFRERLVKMGFDTMEQVVERCHPVQMFIQHRKRQMEQFARVSSTESQRGFRIKPRSNAELTGGAENTAKMCRILEDFFMNTGFGYDPDREDDFADFLEYFTRDHLAFDQNCTELQRTSDGKLWAFWYIDPTTIKRVDRDNPSNQVPDDIMYVQELDQSEVVAGAKRISALYTADDLIFDYSNKRSRMKYRGYGYSLVEMSIDLITTVLFAQTYNKDLFIREKIPKGFLSITGDVNTETLQKVRNAWVNEMSGYGGKFAVPIVPSGKDGVGIDWKSLGQNNRDMEYHKLIMLIYSLLGGIWGVDLAELGIKSDDSQALIGESGEPRIQNSKDHGLGSILGYSERYNNKILRKVDTNFVFEYTGLKNEDRSAAAAAAKQEIEGFRTVNEVRVEKGLEPLDPTEHPYADMVLSPQAVTIKMGAAAAAGAGGAAPGGEPGGEPEDGGWGAPGDGEGEETGPEANEDEQNGGGKPEKAQWTVSADEIDSGEDMAKAQVAAAGTIHQFADGFFYMKHAAGDWVRVSKDRKKADEFAEKHRASLKQGNKEHKVAEGHTVRIKPTDKTKLGAGGRGLVARVTAVKDGIARLVDDAGKAYSVSVAALEFAKSRRDPRAEKIEIIIR